MSMGVYIKDMEMPKTCFDCDVVVCVCNRYYDPKFTRDHSERHPDCPLVEMRDECDGDSCPIKYDPDEFFSAERSDGR